MSTEANFQDCEKHNFHNLYDQQNGRRYWHCLKCGVTPATLDLIIRKAAGLEPAGKVLNG